MSRWMKRQTHTPAVAAGVLALAGGVAYATIPDANGVIHGCYSMTSGRLRVIDSGAGQACTPCEKPLNWSQAGAQPPGPGAALAYAHVKADGTIDNDSGNITVQKTPTAGIYCIGVTGGTAHVAVVSLDERNVGGSVNASVVNASYCMTYPNAHDIYVTTRSHTQDGGYPGTDRAFYIVVY